jgi:hypothetical protein
MWTMSARRVTVLLSLFPFKIWVNFFGVVIQKVKPFLSSKKEL